MIRHPIKSMIYFGCCPLPVTVTTRTITCLIGNPYKPSFATVTARGPHPRFIHQIESFPTYSSKIGYIFPPPRPPSRLFRGNRPPSFLRLSDETTGRGFGQLLCHQILALGKSYISQFFFGEESMFPWELSGNHFPKFRDENKFF